MLLTGESQDDSPVVFKGLANGVFYNVVVFPLTGNGIVGTNVAFSVVLLTPEPTTTTVNTATPGKATDPVSCEAIIKFLSCP